jgi:hemolysin activation/secretion protein
MPTRTDRLGRAGAAAALIALAALCPPAAAQQVVPVRPADYKRHSKPLEPEHRADPVELPERVIPESVDDTPLTDNPLAGVRFVARPSDVLAEPNRPGIQIENVPLLDNDEFRAVVKPYLGKPLSWKLISEVVRDTIMYYRAKDRPVVDVIPPEQDVTEGILQLLVIEARVAEVKVTGLKWFDEDYIRGLVRLQPGDVIEAKPLLADCDYINRNPFRFVRPIFEPGEEFGTTDVVIDAKDRLPIRFYGGYDNTGSRATGLERFFVGFNAGNVFDRGHEVGYQYTTNKRVKSLGIHSAYWRIPLPNRDVLAFFGNFSHYEAKTGYDFDSRNWMAHVRYISELPSRFNLRHAIEFGLDFRRLDNDVQFGGATVYDDFVDVAQFAFQYGGRLKDRLGDTSWTFNLYGAPCSDLLTNHQNTGDYRQVRAGTDATYMYSHLTAERLWVLPERWSIFNRLTAQASTDRLIPSEQLGLGGYNRVRGYDDFEVLADSGLMATLELRTPEWALGSIDSGGKLEHFLQFLAFSDYGWAHNRGHYAADVFKTADMLSVGLGLRYRINHNLKVRFDFAKQLETIPQGNVGHCGRCHVSVILSY